MNEKTIDKIREFTEDCNLFKIFLSLPLKIFLFFMICLPLIKIIEVDMVNGNLKKISEKSRVARSGKAIGAAVVENVHLLYLNDDALEYLQGIIGVLNKEFNNHFLQKD